MEKVGTVAAASDQIGKELTDLLTTPGLKEADLEAKLAGLAQRQQQGVAQAKTLKPPGPLRTEQLHVVEALELRVAGLQGLLGAFHATAGSKDSTAAGKQLAEQAARFLASDVVWDDLVKTPAIEELKRQGIGGVAVPDSAFVSNLDFASTRSLTAVWQRVNGATTGTSTGGLHGTGIVSVKAEPGGQTLSSTAENTVRATTDLAFAVTVQDTGGNQEVKIPVTLTIQQSPSPIVQHQTIDLVNAGEQKTLVFRNLGQVQFATKTTVKVDVQPVPGEKNITNNSAEYPVIFSLG
jgi:hypothetical protein